MIEQALSGELAELSRLRRPGEFVRLLLRRLWSERGLLVVSGGLMNQARTQVAVVQAGTDGWRESLVDVAELGPLADFFADGRHPAEAYGLGGDHVLAGIELIAPLEADGRVVGWIGVGGADVGLEDRLRIEELSLLGSIALRNAALERSVGRSVTEVATVLSSLIESRDTYTESHCVALAEMSVAVGIRMGLGDHQLTRLNLAGHLHDIGKITVPDDVLLKRGPLDEDEFAVMKAHASVGERVLSKMSYFVDLAPVVGQHHERFDGSGYPRGLRGEDILLEARILSVADAFDAMTSSRPYRRALPWSAAVEEIERGSGGQFDPGVAATFLRYLEGEQTQWKTNISH